MNILFIHQNFPAQFKHLAPALVRRGHAVTALTVRKTDAAEWQGVRVVNYAITRGMAENVHPWLRDFEVKTIRGEACFRAAVKLREEGFRPDVIVAHHGWGESLFLKEVWPEARLGIYCEFYYQAHGADVGFDPEFPVKDPEGAACRLRLKNLNNLLHFETADAALSPTEWQASTFPDSFRQKITVAHDGIDTDLLAPDSQAVLTLGSGLRLTGEDEVVTFVNRNLEPYRGYHTFMRALPEILRRRPKAHVLVVGGDGVSYGAKAPGGKSWKQLFIDEVRPGISDQEWGRVRFLGRVPYSDFVRLLQLSTLHIYLTYPFVLSWSLLEAMSCGCAILGSDTEPLAEAIRHDETGRLVDFFEPGRLAEEACALLDDPDARRRLGENARRFALKTYDLKRVCLPRQLKWVEGLAPLSSSRAPKP